MDLIGFLCVSLNSSTAQLHDSLGSRRACACSEAGFSNQIGDRAWGFYYRRARFCCVCLCGQKDSIQRILIKKYFLFTVGSIYRVRRFTTRSRSSLKDVRKSRMMQMMRKWLNEQSKDFYAAGFDAHVKRWDKCMNVGGYVEKIFFSYSKITCFISICDLFTDSP
jgi:23S rRNA maturation mini-RNase III